MELQKRILGQYIILFKEPTLKEISHSTGIQITRVFRLFNGSTMKLSEYQIFQKKINEIMGLSHSLEDIANICSLKLSPKSLKDIEVFLIRKLEIWKIKNNGDPKPKETNQVFA